MTTASTHTSLMGRLRMVALAGTLALSAMIPVVPTTLASGDDVVVTPASAVSTDEQFDISAEGGLIGLSAMVNAGGDGVNLRATAEHDSAIVASVSDGAIVALRVDQVDTVYDADGITRWWPVAGDGQDGWISGFYLTDPDAAAVASIDELSDGTTGADSAESTSSNIPFDYTGSMTAKISADGDGLVLRADAGRNSDAVTSLSDGTIVDLRIDALDTVYDAEGTRWWPVAVDGYEGWVSGFYLVDLDAAPNVSDVPSDTVPTVVFHAGDSVAVETETGSGLVVRVDPTPDGERLTSLHEGQEVQVVGGPESFDGSVNGWYLISTGDVTGYVDGDLLVLTASAPDDTAPAEAGEGDFVTGNFAEVRTGDGDGVELRAEGNAESDQAGYAPNQGLVEILSGPTSNGWYEIRWDQQTGFIDGSLLVASDAPRTAQDSSADETEPAVTEAAATATEAPVADAAFANGDYAGIDAGSDVGVNVRDEPGTDAEQAGFLDEGAVVRITEGPDADADGNDWYRVTDGAQNGWVRADLMIPSSAPAEATDEEETSVDAEATEAPSKQAGSPGFILPLSDYRFTQDFGCSSLGFYTYNPAFGCSVHDGIDLAATSGTPISAVGDGTVVAAGWCDCGLGNYVEIDHGSGLHSVYGHMASQPTVSVGQTVSQGDVIGPVGSTGLSTGPHVHFMIRQDGTAQDPKNYLPAVN